MGRVITKRDTPLPLHPGNAIVAARTKVKLSGRKLSAASGICFVHLPELEHGRVDMTVRTLCRIAFALKLPPAHLLFEAERQVIPDLRKPRSTRPSREIDETLLLWHLGQTIATRRERAAILQRDFADMVELNRNYLRDVEHDKSAPTMGVFCAIAYALNASGCELLARALDGRWQ